MPNKAALGRALDRALGFQTVESVYVVVFVVVSVACYILYRLSQRARESLTPRKSPGARK
jgi:hypothetical protein